MKHWLQAFRLHTLPLASGSIILGSCLSGADGFFSLPVLILSLLTATLLQILSNLANDYGDSFHGADNDSRVGPARAVQSGTISAELMKKAMNIFILLSLLSGIALLVVASNKIGWVAVAVMLGIGIACIAGAIAYTSTAKPYGYKGLGDFSVFLFFGWIAVCGTYFLHTGAFHFDLLFPASAYGFLSSGVLNLNNIRDILTDKAAGKFTVAVRLGFRNARIYHAFLITFAFIGYLVTAYNYFSYLWQLIVFVFYLAFISHVIRLFSSKTPEEVDPLLKQLAIFTFFYALIFGLSIIE